MNAAAAAHQLRLSSTDAAITVAIVAWAIAEAASIRGDAPVEARLAFAVAATTPMVIRNRFPAAALGIAAAAFLADVFWQVLPLFAVTPIQLLPLATYAVASLGADRRASGLVAIVAVLTPPLIYIGLVTDAPVTITDIISLLVIQTVASGAGWAVRGRREEAERQAERLRVASAAGDEVVQSGLGEERARIARELRAIVARNLAAMERGVAGLPGRGGLAEAAALLQRRSADVMAELQRLLGVLHDAQPPLAHPVSVAQAVAVARERGWTITLGDVPAAAPGATLAAGRVTEEVLAGAPPGPGAVRMRVTGEDGGLRLRLAGAAPRPTALEDPVSRSSLDERVRLHGGRARIVRRRRWVVDARLPAAAAARPPRGTYLLGDAVVVGTASLIVVADARAPGGAGPLLSVALGALVFVVPLALRRRAPLAVALVIAAGLFALEAGGVLPDVTRTPIIAALLGSGTAAMHIASRTTALVATAAVGGSAVVVNLMQLPPGEPKTDTPIILFMCVMAYAFGRLVRENTDRARDARLGEEQVAATQRLRLRSAVEEERRAVARDLHDVVAHGVSLIGVLAGAAAAQGASDPARAAASLEAARSTIAQVRVEVDRLTAALGVGAGLGVGSAVGHITGDAGPGGDSDPAPVGLVDLERLVDSARRGGQQVALDLRDGGGVQAGVAVSAYRIVQESLTNARKHARGAAAHVRVARVGDLLEVVVENARPDAARPGPGTGRGIAGMRERARLLGGELVAEPTAAGGFRVQARIPLDRAD